MHQTDFIRFSVADVSAFLDCICFNVSQNLPTKTIKNWIKEMTDRNLDEATFQHFIKSQCIGENKLACFVYRNIVFAIFKRLQASLEVPVPSMFLLLGYAPALRSKNMQERKCLKVTNALAYFRKAARVSKRFL
jgi:hypothetical protein